MRLPLTAIPIALLVLGASSAHAQTCNEPHYRWSEKIDQSLGGKTATPVDVSDILTWAPRPLTAKDQCAARAGRELQLFTVTAYVRRIRLHEQDGDWHLELTEEEASPVPASCIVAEIPAPAYAPVYDAARHQLAVLVDTTTLGPAGDLTTPVLVTLTGAAFFDGYHQKRGPGGAVRASQHGRCNSSVRALWELHPVYKVAVPSGP